MLETLRLNADGSLFFYGEEFKECPYCHGKRLQVNYGGHGYMIWSEEEGVLTDSFQKHVSSLHCFNDMCGKQIRPEIHSLRPKEISISPRTAGMTEEKE